MRFLPTGLSDVWLIELEPQVDERGWFCRTLDVSLFERHGLTSQFPHQNLAFNVSAGILRGLHYQLPPRAEVKVVQCVVGAVYDVVVDLRPDSPTHKLWQGFTLDRPDRMLYVPIGFAHGYQTLEDSTLVSYLMGETYSPKMQRGLRWDDPELAIDWPSPPTLSEKDASYSDVDWTAAWPAS